ncbi:MAG: hypothetical protein A2900_01185 [Candidatus Chisholmbacteria bacterium RIFCSPLOWO2_01_FULL_50_28]|uniref:BioF2-like acetyltransferase domain-containing protein n=1 Tax=Candidatus Chisholmbacteria bacterium RIFCSPHIGHO2_01_FULL_52_32 TaxID=1797591 RepID=A0A1G1VUP8_9BACT|nr:MAG: hypothetical protein A2786_06245 [Candidatus Chisholmbacteria bacterium RIFCSPHIGHO2_01_FULL_52_32]OGY20608.1 MAG: hypothetical protein A2900_01185 [Candidatus Chisholmbacteria bacterium RIFCSPLOWO2_01_FULL_50_28]
MREVRIDEKDTYHSLVSHPVQSWEWGEFKERTAATVVRLGFYQTQRLTSAFQLTFHSIPSTSFQIGYFPKGSLPDKRMLEALLELGKRKNAVFVKLEPNIPKGEGESSLAELSRTFDLRKGKPIFTPHTFRVNLTKSEEELLAAMKPKTRYNIRVAQRYGVTVVEDNSDAAFEEYLRLTFETAKRQRFYTHDEVYHRQMWGILRPAGIAHLLTATWKDQILVAWIVFTFKDVIYYPYGASSSEHRDLMASNLMMWEAMRFGKLQGCRTFDLWGALGPNPDPKDPWYGFHRFKEGYGGELVEFVGSFDLVVNPQVYSLFRFADDLRWKWLRFAARFHD